MAAETHRAYAKPRADLACSGRPWRLHCRHDGMTSETPKSKRFPIARAVARFARKALRNWRERHQLALNFWLHMLGIPLAMAGIVLLFLVPWHWGLGSICARLSTPIHRPSRRGQRCRRMGWDQATPRFAYRGHLPPLAADLPTTSPTSPKPERGPTRHSRQNPQGFPKRFIADCRYRQWNHYLMSR